MSDPAPTSAPSKKLCLEIFWMDETQPNLRTGSWGAVAIFFPCPWPEYLFLKIFPSPKLPSYLPPSSCASHFSLTIFSSLSCFLSLFFRLYCFYLFIVFFLCFFLCLFLCHLCFFSFFFVFALCVCERGGVVQQELVTLYNVFKVGRSQRKKSLTISKVVNLQKCELCVCGG
jgi:hypothetical protein